MEPVESEEVMTVGGGCTAGHEEKDCTLYQAWTGAPWRRLRFQWALHSPYGKSRTGVELNGHDEKALPVVHRKGLISYGAFVQN